MPLKSKSKSKPQQLPEDMERAIRDFTADKNKVKEKIFQEDKPLKKNKKKIIKIKMLSQDINPRRLRP